MSSVTFLVVSFLLTGSILLDSYCRGCDCRGCDCSCLNSGNSFSLLSCICCKACLSGCDAFSGAVSSNRDTSGTAGPTTLSVCNVYSLSTEIRPEFKMLVFISKYAHGYKQIRKIHSLNDRDSD